MEHKIKLENVEHPIDLPARCEIEYNGIAIRFRDGQLWIDTMGELVILPRSTNLVHIERQ